MLAQEGEEELQKKLIALAAEEEVVDPVRFAADVAAPDSCERSRHNSSVLRLHIAEFQLLEYNLALDTVQQRPLPEDFDNRHFRIERRRTAAWFGKLVELALAFECSKIAVVEYIELDNDTAAVVVVVVPVDMDTDSFSAAFTAEIRERYFIISKSSFLIDQDGDHAGWH